mmetsp:Transcript_32390/g.82569  ORF Transcript_32390/g.82569 Transcript_32390/m.82569 type:complete len:211 (+) Transcript_32390:460-1092(+)
MSRRRTPRSSRGPPSRGSPSQRRTPRLRASRRTSGAARRVRRSGARAASASSKRSFSSAASVRPPLFWRPTRTRPIVRRPQSWRTRRWWRRRRRESSPTCASSGGVQSRALPVTSRGPVRDRIGLLRWRRPFRAARHSGRRWATRTPSTPQRGSSEPRSLVGHARRARRCRTTGVFRRLFIYRGALGACGGEVWGVYGKCVSLRKCRSKI